MNSGLGRSGDFPVRAPWFFEIPRGITHARLLVDFVLPVAERELLLTLRMTDSEGEQLGLKEGSTLKGAFWSKSCDTWFQYNPEVTEPTAGLIMPLFELPRATSALAVGTTPWGRNADAGVVRSVQLGVSFPGKESVSLTIFGVAENA